MEHVAIDLGGRESQVCCRSEQGVILLERRWRTQKLDSFLETRPHSRVILETSSEAFQVAEMALWFGHEVRVVPSTLVRSLGVGARKQKNDVLDARVLSEVSCRIDLPSVHIPSPQAQQRRARCRSRELLVQMRTKAINHVRGYLRTQVISQPPRNPKAFAEQVRQKMLFEAGRPVPPHIGNILTAMEEITLHLAELDEELLSEAKLDPVCRRLMTVPGVGPATAMRYVAAIDQRERFHSAHRVESYLGLTTGENSSSERVRRIGITKAGSAQVRVLLIQAAWSALRCRPQDPMVVWATQIAARRNKNIAVTALARKLAGILFAIWRDGTTYDPSRGARKLMPTP